VNLDNNGRVSLENKSRISRRVETIICVTLLRLVLTVPESQEGLKRQHHGVVYARHVIVPESQEGLKQPLDCAVVLYDVGRDQNLKKG